MLLDDCGCGCGHDECKDDCSEEGTNEEQAIITMVDAETGEEYQFSVVDDFEFKDQAYCVLVTIDEDEPELVITKVVQLEDGEEGLMSLDEEEADEIYAEYDRLCEEADFDDEDDTDKED
jgi:Protein of unknown function (DUF1292)